MSVPLRINIGITTGQENAVQPFHRRVHIVSVWNETNVQRHRTSSLQSLTVIARKIKAFCRSFDAHWYADARSVIHLSIHYVLALFTRNYINPRWLNTALGSLRTAILQGQ